jgi:uncharacterized protein YjiS (DUF1127 family)
MSKHLTQGWALSRSETAREGSLQHQRGSSTPAADWLHTLFFWIDRSRQRAALGELADLNNHLLEDIGVSKEQALHEAAKPFWQ